MRAFRRLVLLLGIFPCLASPGYAQLSSAAQVSVITVLPGTGVHTLWGHSALRIYDPARGMDVAYNYGTFDFGDPIVFMARFAYGELDYQLSRQSFPGLMNFHRTREPRTVIEQRLVLSPEQKDALYRFVEDNARAENRTYRYDFLQDNCSTRVLALFTEVLGLDGPAAQATDETYRELLRPYAAWRTWLSLGIHTAMALPADRPPEDLSFLPLELMGMLDGMQNDATDLVAWTDTLHVASPLQRNTVPWALLTLWLTFLAGAWITWRGYSRLGTAFDRLVYSVLGLAGLLIAFFWLISLHVYTRPNLLIAWLWPTHLVAPWLGGSNLTRWYHRIAAACAALFVLAWAFLPQGIPAPLFPMALLVILRSGRHFFVPRTGFEPVLPA